MSFKATWGIARNDIWKGCRTTSYSCLQFVDLVGETEAGWPKARHLLLKPQLEHEALMTARALMNDEDFWLRYRERSGIEGTISQAVRTCGARISRYIGSKKMALQNTLIGLAINVTRLGVWLSGTPLAKTRKSKLETLSAA